MSETTVRGIPRSEITYLPLDKATAEPGDGFWLLFFRKSPQCNRNESIARSVTAKCHPGAEVIFVPRVYLKHDCGDYV